MRAGMPPMPQAARRCAVVLSGARTCCCGRDVCAAVRRVLLRWCVRRRVACGRVGWKRRGRGFATARDCIQRGGGCDSGRYGCECGRYVRCVVARWRGKGCAIACAVCLYECMRRRPTWSGRPQSAVLNAALCAPRWRGGVLRCATVADALCARPRGACKCRVAARGALGAMRHARASS